VGFKLTDTATTLSTVNVWCRLPLPCRIVSTVRTCSYKLTDRYYRMIYLLKPLIRVIVA
jgi:hypothetical protein